MKKRTFTPCTVIHHSPLLKLRIYRYDRTLSHWNLESYSHWCFSISWASCVLIYNCFDNFDKSILCSFLFNLNFFNRWLSLLSLSAVSINQILHRRRIKKNSNTSNSKSERNNFFFFCWNYNIIYKTRWVCKNHMRMVLKYPQMRMSWLGSSSQDVSQLDSVYIFCITQFQSGQWTQKWAKIRLFSSLFRQQQTICVCVSL